jgi:flagellar hook-associated protein 3 FlgL
MRVSDKMIFDRAAQASMAARDRMQAAADESSTGVRVSHPGDDPAAAGLIVSRQYAATRYEAIGDALSRTSDELAASDAALSGFGELVTRAQELAVQFSNSTYSENQRAVAAKEVDVLFQHTVALLNTRVGDRYMFGGHLDASEPFAADGTYQGDTGVRQAEIAPGVLADVSIRADVLAKGAGGGADVLATLEALSDALKANDLDAIRATLGDLDSGVQQVAIARAGLGAQMAVLDGATVAARTAKDATDVEISGLQDADAFEATTKLALARTALDAALTASAQSFRISLLDKLS